MPSHVTLGRIMDAEAMRGLEGLAAIEDYAIQRTPDLYEVDDHDIDWSAVQRTYMGDAHIARFMDGSGLTRLMESHRLPQE